MNKLTDTFLRGLKATGKVQKHSDGGGLYIHISPTGGKLWRMAYTFDGKQKTLSLGAYAIATGRAERDTAADLRGACRPRGSNFATTTEPKAIGALLRDIDAYAGNVIVRAALRLASYVFVRPGELRRAERVGFDFYYIQTVTLNNCVYLN